MSSRRRICAPPHMPVLAKNPLRLEIISEYVEYFNGARPHQALEQEAPLPSGTLTRAEGEVIALPVPCLPLRREAPPARLSGLHHDYRRAA